MRINQLYCLLALFICSILVALIHKKKSQSTSFKSTKRVDFECIAIIQKLSPSTRSSSLKRNYRFPQNPGHHVIMTVSCHEQRSKASWPPSIIHSHICSALEAWEEVHLCCSLQVCSLLLNVDASIS